MLLLQGHAQAANASHISERLRACGVHGLGLGALQTTVHGPQCLLCATSAFPNPAQPQIYRHFVSHSYRWYGHKPWCHPTSTTCTFGTIPGRGCNLRIKNSQNFQSLAQQQPPIETPLHEALQITHMLRRRERAVRGKRQQNRVECIGRRTCAACALPREQEYKGPPWTQSLGCKACNDHPVVGAAQEHGQKLYGPRPQPHQCLQSHLACCPFYSVVPRGNPRSRAGEL